MQAAFYVDGFIAVTQSKYDCCFAFFAVEKTAPFVNSAFELGCKSILAGQMAYRKALDLYAKCKADNNWPMYANEINMIEMPGWALEIAGVGPGNML